MALDYDHDAILQKLALKIEKDKRYGLVKFFVPWGDQKTDLIGALYPDITCLRREGKTKLLIEVVTPYSFEDSDEVRRLEGFSDFCAANNWEFYVASADQKTQELAARKFEGRTIRPKAMWLTETAPFEETPSQPTPTT